MIPYDELVIALQTWRAKQGLPVGQMSGQLMPPSAMQPPAMQPPPGRPAQPFLSNVVTPPPLAPTDGDESLEVDGALIEEAHYENEGDDFAMAFGQAALAEDGEDSTAIGGSPRPSDNTLEEGTEVASPGGRRGGGGGGGRGEDW